MHRRRRGNESASEVEHGGPISFGGDAPDAGGGGDACCLVGDSLWWEQQAKLPLCLEQVEASERRSGQRRFNYVMKLRSDLPVALAGPSPKALAAVACGGQPQGASHFAAQAAAHTTNAAHAAHGLAGAGAPCGAASAHVRGVWMAPWVTGWGPGGGAGCYRESDWFALVARADARTYFGASQRLSCGWQRCYLQRLQLAKDHLREITYGGCIANERMLVEWLLWHGVPLHVLAVADVPDAIWSRATPSAPLEQLAVLTPPSEVAKALGTAQITVNESHRWHAPLLDEVLQRELPVACLRMLGKRLE